MTHKITSLYALLALFLLLLAITACDSAPAPSIVGTPTPSGVTEASPTTLITSVEATPDAPTSEVTATTNESRNDTPVTPEASPTVDEAIQPPIPTDTERPAATSTRKAAATATHTSKATATVKATAKATATKQKATPEATIDAAPGVNTYIFPVQPFDVTNYGEFHHDYPATDIFCPIGSKFVAPTDGVVDYVSYKDVWDPAVNDPASRGGLSVAIIGVDGVRYYGSHLSKIADGISPGVEVKAGDLLGRTGKTGDARFVDPHLHFGISHPTTPDDWETRRGEISPYKYLKAWQAGKMLKPVVSP